MFANFVSFDEQAGYRFNSQTFKDVELRCDGVFEADDHGRPTLICEFQFQKEADVYPRTFEAMARYQLANKERSVGGVIMFLHEAYDPKPECWHCYVQGCQDFFRVLYLEEELKALEERQPNHVLNALFGPFLEESEEKVLS